MSAYDACVERQSSPPMHPTPARNETSELISPGPWGETPSAAPGKPLPIAVGGVCGCQFVGLDRLCQYEDQSPVYAVSRLQGIEDPCRLINPVIHPRDSLLAVIGGPRPLTAGLFRDGDGRTHRVDLTPEQLGEKPCLLALTRLDRTRPPLGRDRIAVSSFAIRMVSIDEAIRRGAPLRNRGGAPNASGGTGIRGFAFAGQPGFGKDAHRFGAPAPLASAPHGILTSR
jgi:hypothetical protein